jgi:hypothetical protein
VGKEKRVIFQAGRLWYAKQYTPLSGTAPPGEKRERQRYSTRVREAINFRTSYEKLWLILECNFKWNDLFVTLGYRDEKLPKNKEAAERQLSYFIRALRAERKSKGKDLVYVRVTEGYHSDGRLHHHLILNAVGEDFEAIRRLWKKNGTDVDFELYCRKDPVAHAKYITKEPREKGRRYVGDRIWRVSRNCKRPVIVKEDVEAGSRLLPPAGAHIQTSSEENNTFGRFQYVRALLSADVPNSGLG